MSTGTGQDDQTDRADDQPDRKRQEYLDHIEAVVASAPPLPEKARWLLARFFSDAEPDTDTTDPATAHINGKA